MVDVKIPTSADLNQIHKEFWDKEAKLIEKRMGDSVVVALAAKQLNDEQRRHIDFIDKRDFDVILATAESDVDVVRVEQGRGGGQKNKGKRDASQRLILDILQETSTLKTDEVWKKINELPRNKRPKDFLKIKPGAFNQRVTQARKDLGISVKKESDEAV